MISASKYAVFLLLVLSVTGCVFKKREKPAPAQAQAPAITTGQTGTPLPTLEPETPPPTPLPSTTNEQPVTPPQTARKKHVSTHKPKPPAPAAGAATSSVAAASPSTTPAAPAAAPPADTKAANPPAAVPPANQTASNDSQARSSIIGELSPGGDGSTGSETRRKTTELITNTENGLNAIKRPFSTQEAETVSQIKSFLSKAKSALNNDDLDGAQTLATKAKVLLEELTKQ
jgi:hypothetical protein